MSTVSTFIVTSSDDMSQVKVDTQSPQESVESLVTYLNKLALGCGAASVNMQVNSNASVSASGTLTVSTGVAGNTATINGTTLTCVDKRDTTDVTFTADTAGSLNSTYFTFESKDGSNKYYIWFNINSAGVDPAVSGRTGIAVAGATGATAATLATAAVAAASAVVGLTVTAGASGHIITKNVAPGVAVATADGAAATSFTFTHSITGSAVGASEYEKYATDTLTAADMVRAINANTSINPFVSAANAAGVVTVTSVFAGVAGNMTTLAASGGGVAAGSTRLTGGTGGTSAIMHLGL